MSSAIVYFQQKFPKPTETFISAEIRELIRRGYDAWVVCLDADTALLQNDILAKRTIMAAPARTSEALFANLIGAIQSKNPRYLHAHWITEAGRILAGIAAKLDLPFGFTCHAADLWLRGNRLEPEEIRVLGENHRCVTAACEGSRHRSYLQWCGVPDEKIVITPNSVDERLLPQARQEPPQEILKLVAVGRPVAKKGFKNAVDAARLLRLRGVPVELEIIGGGDESSTLGADLRSYTAPFPFVTTTGMYPHAEVLRAVSRADMLIMPSMVAENGDSDGIPTVLIEAMLLGVPVVATDVGSVTDLVIAGNTGFIARPGDAASLADAILAARELFKVPEQGEQLVEAAKRHAKRHETQSSVNALAAHLEKMLGRF